MSCPQSRISVPVSLHLVIDLRRIKVFKSRPRTENSFNCSATRTACPPCLPLASSFLSCASVGYINLSPAFPMRSTIHKCQYATSCPGSFPNVVYLSALEKPGLYQQMTYSSQTPTAVTPRGAVAQKKGTGPREELVCNAAPHMRNNTFRMQRTDDSESAECATHSAQEVTMTM